MTQIMLGKVWRPLFIRIQYLKWVTSPKLMKDIEVKVICLENCI